MSVWKSFKSLYFATLLMLLGSGLLSTYLALHVAERADGIWVGALMTGFYLGLVLGGKLGHRLIARVGHIRTYVASAGIVTAAVLLHGLTESLPAWLSLRVVVGLGMMSMYMVVESWLNEQSTSDERGMVFSGYMMASYLGMVLGQLVLAALPDLNINLLLFVALCFSLCLVPVALTRRIHPEPLHPAPLEPRYFLQRVPLSMLTSIVAGAMVGAFYGLAPLYASRIGLPTQMIGLFMATCIVAGLLVQGPLGWLSDRLDRPTLIRVGSALLMLIALPQAIHAPANNNASRMLERDVDNLATYFGQFAPDLLTTQYGKEIWALYETGKLQPESELTGIFKSDEGQADLNEIMHVIDNARLEDAARRVRKALLTAAVKPP